MLLNKETLKFGIPILRLCCIVLNSLQHLHASWHTGSMLVKVPTQHMKWAFPFIRFQTPSLPTLLAMGLRILQLTHFPNVLEGACFVQPSSGLVYTLLHLVQSLFGLP